MKLSLCIDLDNADFRDESDMVDGAAVARVLANVAAVWRDVQLYPGREQTVRDWNGNVVGWAKVAEG